MNLHTQLKIQKPRAGLENKRESKTVGRESVSPHQTIVFSGIIEALIGNQAPDHGVPEKNVGFSGLLEDEPRVMGITKMQALTQEHVDEVVVLVETEAEKAGVDMLEVFEGVEALKKAFLDF